MKVIFSNEITITDVTQEILDWCKRELVLPNPEYAKKRTHGVVGEEYYTNIKPL